MIQTDDALYTDLILDLSRNPANKGVIEDAEITHSGVNVSCGDHVRVYLKLDFGGNGGEPRAFKIKNATFEGNGCAISVAAASLITEEIKGKTIDKILYFRKEDIFKLLGAPLGPSRVKCGMLCLETIQEGINLPYRR